MNEIDGLMGVAVHGKVCKLLTVGCHWGEMMISLMKSRDERLIDGFRHIEASA